MESVPVVEEREPLFVRLAAEREREEPERVARLPIEMVLVAERERVPVAEMMPVRDMLAGEDKERLLEEEREPKERSPEETRTWKEEPEPEREPEMEEVEMLTAPEPPFKLMLLARKEPKPLEAVMEP